MAEEAVAAPAADVNVEARAREQGWLPNNGEYKGNPDKWVDATTYLERGEQVMPILRKHRDDLQKRVTERDGEIANLKRQVSEQAEAMEGFKKWHEEDTKRREEQARTNLKDELRKARESGDTDAEVEILGAIQKLNEPKPQPEKKPEKAEQPATYDPGFISWVKENPWFDSQQLGQKGNEEATLYAYSVVEFLKGTRKGLNGRPFLDAVSELVLERYPDLGPSRGKPSKVEGSRGGEGGATGGGRSFADLPSDARATAHRQAEKFGFVGPNKMYKTMKDWEAYYAKEYFGE